RTQRRKYDSVWASQHEELCRDEVVAPYVCDLLVGPDLGVAPDRCHSPGAAGDAGLDAATHARRAERTADGGVMSVPAGPPGVATCTDHYCTRNCLSSNE